MSKNKCPQPGKVLVMDDDHSVRATVGQMLQCLGYDVELATDGNEAASIYLDSLNTDYPVDVVILDLLVDGNGGAVVGAELILADDPEAKLLLASGSIQDPVVANYRDHGFAGVIAKPFGMADLGMAIGELLG